MKLSRLLFWLFSAFTLIFTAYCLTFCSSNTNIHNEREKPLYLPQAENDNIMTVISGIDKGEKADVRYEDELPPEEFIGTIIEEHFDYIIVEPNIDEEEYKIAKKIRIDFIKTQGKDYLYGTGRKVHITYIPHINVTDGMGYIETDAIETEGFEDFELSVIPNEADITTLVLNNNSLHEFNPSYNLYYSGIDDVHITVDSKTMPLSTALRLGKVTLSGIISRCNTLAALDKIEVLEYKDGGSKKYVFHDFAILKYHTLDGNNDMFIGKTDIDINAINRTQHFCVRAYMDYGLIITPKDVTGTGGTFVYEKIGGNATGALQFGDEFHLEVLTESGWDSVAYNMNVKTENLVWHQVAYLINDFTPFTQQKIDWSYLYGELQPGKYRLVKEIMDFRGTGDYDKFTAYSYFEINN